MEDLMEKMTALDGGEFVIKEADINDTFIPEDFDEEQKMIEETVMDFIDQEILPIYDKIEHQEEGVNKGLCAKFGDLGLFSTHMPEYLGGMDLDFNTNTLIGEKIGFSGSFSVTYNAHTGIGMLPILYFGTKEQKEKYLPDLMSGAKVGSYCLTEPSSGSDALSAKAKAVLTEDGKHYILNGQKMWITNAGFADLFTVFAQVDGDKFTAFLIEAGTPGLSLGEEEKKLGIKGSSTRMVYLEDVKIPVENVLGEVGKGHLIAFNVLNTGRFKLGASTLGSAKAVFNMAVQYANERHQFKTPISSFGAIQYKLAQMTINTFVGESSLYRCSHQINEKIKALKSDGASYGDAKLQAAEEYALECSILKIVGSEVLDYAVDENVQIHGGMGFSEEAFAARAFRDARINRIFEGTNEINRMVIMSTLLKRAMKGQLDIVTPALAVQSELTNGLTKSDDSSTYAHEEKAIKGFKKILLMVLGSAAKLQMEGKLDLKKEQEILMNMADIIVAIYNAESTLMRVKKLVASNHEKAELAEAILKVYMHDAAMDVSKHALDAVASFVKTEKQGDYIYGIRQYAKYPLQNVKELRRKIAAVHIEANEYVL
jgi:alkylation response protein AidB-like acyl-CoA dehydrogenase